MKNNIVDAIIEIPLNTKNKFEIDETTGKIRLDRVLYSAMNYPVEYGYIENTLALDGDPLDILLVSSAPTFPGCIVEARVIGYLEVIDNGHEDYKIISVVNVDPRYNEINTLNDMPKFILEEIKDFCDYIWLENLNLRGTFKPTIINYIKEKHPELNDLYNKIYTKKDMSYWEGLDKKVQEYADKNGFMYVIDEEPFLKNPTGKPIIINYFYHEKIRQLSKNK